MTKALRSVGDFIVSPCQRAWRDNIATAWVEVAEPGQRSGIIGAAAVVRRRKIHGAAESGIVEAGMAEAGMAKMGHRG